MLISEPGKDYRVTVDVSLKALRKMMFLDEPFLTRILFILQLAMSKEMTRVSW